MEADIEIHVECEGSYVRGRHSRYDPNYGWEPAEESEIANFKVYIRHENGKLKIDITDYLSETDRDKLYDEYLLMHEE